MSLQTRFEFTLPRGFVDRQGVVHRDGTMRLATARDELEPLRDPMIDGPDDPRLTVVVLARVVERLGTMDLVTSADIEDLFAADLAFLQDFYGVINFGSQAEYEALLAAQRDAGPPVTSQTQAGSPPGSAVPEDMPSITGLEDAPAREEAPVGYQRPTRAAIEELSRDGR